jgi:hypothetical protein
MSWTKFSPHGTPEFSDSEVITIALFAEMVFHGDEDKTLHFIRQYHLDLFPNLLDNSRFNRRRHQLTQRDGGHSRTITGPLACQPIP